MHQHECLTNGSHVQAACCYGHTAEVTRVAWSHDGRMLATGEREAFPSCLWGFTQILRIRIG